MPTDSGSLWPPQSMQLRFPREQYSLQGLYLPGILSGCDLSAPRVSLSCKIWIINVAHP
jgi:hypothetical protein